MRFVDIHQHIVYGIDDGPAAFTESKQMLTAAKAQGITAIFATSHAMPAMETFPLRVYRARLTRLQDWADRHSLSLTLLPGAEILYAPDAVALLDNGAIPLLGDTNAALIEFYPDAEFGYLSKGLRKLLNAGYQPILAHTERYNCLRTRNLEKVEELIAYGVRIQVNANTVIRNRGLFKDRFVHALLKKDYIDYVASDAHGPASGRPVCMAKAYDVLKKQQGRKTAAGLCGKNQKQDLIFGGSENDKR